ncbi:UNVERIFIED_CONTAM: ABC transporter, putative [Hammondia hammondi]|eukprot:XP_008886884.1 ABC transporter, putative [Hammondia hammondi]
MLAALLRSGSSWVERTPLGRILSRCSDDIFSVDEQIPSALHLFTVIGVTLSAKLLMLAWNAPSLLVVLLPVGVFFWRTSAHFRASARHLKRLEMLTRSPLHERLTEASAGAATIRAFGAERRFYEAYVDKLGEHRRTVQRNQLVHAWLSLRLQGSGAIAQGAFLFIVLFPVFLVPHRLSSMQGELAAVLALGLYTTMPLVRLLTALITSAIRADMQMVAVERLTEYANIPPEDDSYDPLYCRPTASALENSGGVSSVSAARRPLSVASWGAPQSPSTLKSAEDTQSTVNPKPSAGAAASAGTVAYAVGSAPVPVTPKPSAFPLFLPFLSREASCPDLVSLGKKKESTNAALPSLSSSHTSSSLSSSSLSSSVSSSHASSSLSTSSLSSSLSSSHASSSLSASSLSSSHASSSLSTSSLRCPLSASSSSSSVLHGSSSAQASSSPLCVPVPEEAAMSNASAPAGGISEISHEQHACASEKANATLLSGSAYAERVSSCAPPETPKRAKTVLKQLRFDVALPAAPAIAWPTAGRIDFDDVCVEYGPGLAPALSHATFTIYPGETVAMVGRTGAGKSSVLLALTRMVNYTGSIKIDGVDTRRMPRHILRSRLALVPQNPVLFSGSLRSNLDAERLRSNEQIFKILDLCKLGNVVRALPDGLDTRMSAGGECANVEFHIKRSRRSAANTRHHRRSATAAPSPRSSPDAHEAPRSLPKPSCHPSPSSSALRPASCEGERESQEAAEGPATRGPGISGRRRDADDERHPGRVHTSERTEEAGESEAGRHETRHEMRSAKRTETRRERDNEGSVLPGSIRLSPGQQQLLCFCRALLQGAPIMCLDEVNSRVDTGVEEDIISSALRTKLRPCTVLMISHRLEELRSLCDRVIAFYSSRVVEIGAPDVLLDNPNSYFSKLYHAGTTEGQERE